MPNSRGKRKGKGRSAGADPAKSAATSSLLDGSECNDLSCDDVRSEVSSVLSADSEPASDRSVESHANEDEAEESAAIEDAEGKVKEAIDGLSEKSAKHRQDCLKVLIKSFSTSDLSELLEDFIETLSSALEKCVRRGKSEEQCLAAIMIALLSIQIGSVEGGEERFNGFKSVLLPIILDKSAHLQARAKCCEALGVYCFIAAGEMSDVLECMKKLESIFSGSYFKGDGTLPSVSPAVAELHNSALSSWGLLLSVCDWTYAADFLRSVLPQTLSLLKSSDLALRITAGEMVALFYEILYNEDELELASDNVNEEELCESLRSLATDSNKYRAKKDRRQQRSSFREILRTVEEGVAPEDQIKFGREVLEIHSWTRKRQYEALRSVLGTGMNFHLKANELLREMFELGAALPETSYSKGSGSHFERHMHNQAMFKARTKARGKLRDKRTAFRT